MSDRPAATPSGGTGPLLAVLVGRGPGAARYSVRRPEAVIGRGADSDLVVADPSVSERHARLRLADGVWTLTDLGSVNGSWVDGEAVQADLPLASGSAIRLGAVDLVFAAHDRWQDSPRREPADGPRPSFVLSAPPSSRIPVPVLVGLGIIVLALAGYLLTRVG